MKILITSLLFICSICQSQTDDANQKILGKWFMEQYGNTSQTKDQYHIQKTSGTETITVVFNPNNTLDLTYTETKKEKYKWEIKDDKIKITATKDGNKKSEIVGEFEINFWKNDSVLALFEESGSLKALRFKR